MQVEIPPEAIEAVAALSIAGRQNDAWYRARMEDMLRAAVPHLFAVWAEALTSDEAVGAAVQEMFERGYPMDYQEEGFRDAREILRAGAAVLSSVSGKDEPNG